MADTDALRDAADIALDSDPLKVLRALEAVLSECDQWAAPQAGWPAMVPIHKLKDVIASALGIQEGGTQ